MFEFKLIYRAIYSSLLNFFTEVIILSKVRHPTLFHNLTDQTEELGFDYFEPAFKVGKLI